eukprot:TRINITY_DN7748_c0_g1_i2.p1 TRINITY_DN7748_c0_g1~~TRINITY_DN7748_c0_g1_i2.p1  ORF type:complete len:326 (-),score=2.25 TRINITY_DN7748_c0_g1_i2:139-1116(-)
MGLRRDAADFAVPRVFVGSLAMYVLYQRVYSIVTFTSQGAICVAPGCRSFFRRCGHARVARQVRAELKLQELRRVEGAPKAKAGRKGRARFLSNEEEDVGLERQPPDTIRADDDCPEEILRERDPRNLLPCAGEAAQGDRWTRTADWRGLIERQRAHDGDASQLDMMEAVLASAASRGIMEDVSMTLVEPRCGSCGAQRKARHHLRIEPTIMYHHHSAAPAIQVCTSFALCLPCCRVLLVLHDLEGVSRVASMQTTDAPLFPTRLFNMDAFARQPVGNGRATRTAASGSLSLKAPHWSCSHGGGGKSRSSGSCVPAASSTSFCRS